MAQCKDHHGLEFTVSDEGSIREFGRFTSSYLGFRRETAGILGDLTLADPAMPMAVCAKGYLAKLFGSSDQSARAKVLLAELGQLVDTTGANGRERHHAAALAAWCEGDLEKATGAWEAILLDHPNDALALRLAHFTHFYSGDPRRMRDSVARVLPLWSPADADYGFLLGMYAFGLEEAGEYTEAERYGREAVVRNPADAWSVHSVAHVLEMTERPEEGIAWVSGLEPSWSSVNNFRFHLYWHRCLYHLERGEFALVLKLYDEQIVSDIASNFYLDICNASSLLWRLELFGLDVGGRWAELVEVSKCHVGDTDLIFVSLHYLMALIAGGDAAAADRLIATIREWSLLDGTQARACAECGLTLAKGLRLARDGHHRAALETMEPIRHKLDRIGGSRAQRDVFHMIMLDAAKAGRDTLQARGLFAERLGFKAQSSWTWKNYGDVLETLGKDDEAAAARAKARAIIAVA